MKMLTISVIDELLSRLLEGGANHLLRFFGGPDHVPHRNEDFVWF
jgi:hypothetical protein